MLFAIISDVHANLEALTAVMNNMPKYASVVHLGDLVGYGAQPNEVVNLIAQTRGVMGNHDCAALGDPDLLARFNESAKISAIWTKKQLTPSSKTYLESLPYVATITDDAELPFTIAHGSPFEPFKFHYVLDNSAAMKATKAFTTQLCFIGHSHFPESFARPTGSGKIFRERHGLEEAVIHISNETVSSPDILKIENGMQYVVNVGSIGQPRDGDARASYVLLDTTERTITWQRVAYDIASAQATIMNAGLPARNSERLTTGS